LLPSIHLAQLYQMNSLASRTAPTTNSTLPRIKFVVFPVSIMMMLKHLIRTWLTYVSIFRSCHGSLRTNKCFNLVASEIFLSNHYLQTFCACCDTSPSDTLNLLRPIRIGTGQTITIPDETTIHELFIRNPDITLLIPRDLSHLSLILYSSIITISYDR
jgi:hypothetical protein